MEVNQPKALTRTSVAAGPGARNSTTAPIPKLKDSCDTCAASKIRCDKQKPLCGRCERLGYPCFYSPARRTGYARARGQNNTEAAPPKPSTHVSHTNAGSAGGAWPTISMQRNSNASVVTPSGSDRRSGSVTLAQEYTLSASRNNDSGLQNGTTASKSQASTVSGGKFASRMVFAGLAQGSDCVIASVNTVIQLQLATARLQLQQERARSSHLDEGCGHTQQNGQNFGLHDAIDTVTTAFGTLSTVLVCPCFGNPDIGLLAAAIFLSIFDVYRAILRHSVPDSADSPMRPAPTSDADLACVLAAVEDEFSYSSTFDGCKTGRNSGDKSRSTSTGARANVFTTDQVPEELAKVARIVLQFAKRYRDGDAGRQSPDFLKDLDHLLRSQLQSVTMESATRHF
jgi:hypothetical protein